MTTTYRFNDPRLDIDTERPSFLGRHRTSDDPYGDALLVLADLSARGIHLERPHVEAAARLTGAEPARLLDMILSPAVIS